MNQNIKRLVDQLSDLPLEELYEVQRLITHLIGFQRSLQVLNKEIARPGKRGKAYQKVEKKS